MRRRRRNSRVLDVSSESNGHRKSSKKPYILILVGPKHQPMNIKTIKALQNLMAKAYVMARKGMV